MGKTGGEFIQVVCGLVRGGIGSGEKKEGGTELKIGHATVGGLTLGGGGGALGRRNSDMTGRRLCKKKTWGQKCGLRVGNITS